MHTDVAALAAQAAGRAQHTPAWLLGLKAKAARAPLADGSLGVLRRGRGVGVVLGVAQAASGCLAIWASSVGDVELRSAMGTSLMQRRTMTGGALPTTRSATGLPAPPSTTPSSSAP